MTEEGYASKLKHSTPKCFSFTAKLSSVTWNYLKWGVRLPPTCPTSPHSTVFTFLLTFYKDAKKKFCCRKELRTLIMAGGLHLSNRCRCNRTHSSPGNFVGLQVILCQPQAYFVSHVIVFWTGTVIATPGEAQLYFQLCRPPLIPLQ